MQENGSIEEDTFVVKESQTVNIIVGAALLLVVLFSAASKDGLLGMPPKVIIIFVGVGILFVCRGLIRKETLRIDCNGIYQGKELITNWANFLQAYIGQANRLASYQDDFQLILEYRKNGSDSLFTCIIPLSNTQNQSEEEVLAAIQRFYQLSQETIQPTKEPLQLKEGNDT